MRRHDWRYKHKSIERDSVILSYIFGPDKKNIRNIILKRHKISYWRVRYEYVSMWVWTWKKCLGELAPGPMNYHHKTPTSLTTGIILSQDEWGERGEVWPLHSLAPHPTLWSGIRHPPCRPYFEQKSGAFEQKKSPKTIISKRTHFLKPFVWNMILKTAKKVIEVISNWKLPSECKGGKCVLETN